MRIEYGSYLVSNGKGKEAKQGKWVKGGGYVGDEVEGSSIVRRLKGLVFGSTSHQSPRRCESLRQLALHSDHPRASDFDLKKLDVEGVMQTSPNG